MHVISEYRKKYLTNRKVKQLDPDSAHSDALESIYISLLHESAINSIPISDRQLDKIKDLQSNPHFMLLLEEILQLPESEQKEYLRQIAKVPDLQLVK